MTPKEIIAEAWYMTTHVKPIRRWGFIAAILNTLLDMKLLLYQIYLFYIYVILEEPMNLMETVKLLKQYVPLWVFSAIAISLLSMSVLEIFLPKMCLGAVIGLAAKSHKKEEVRGGLVLALYNFFPIFAIHGMFFLATLTTVITIASLILRYMVTGLQIPLIIFLLFLFIISNILKFFTSFAEEEVVICKTPFITALGRSFKLIISHLRHILFLLMLMVMILIRIALNALVLLLLPGVVIGISLVLAFFFSQTISIIISVIVGAVIILIAAYFFAYLHVFQQTVWTITYMELSKLKDLDIIGVEMEEEKGQFKEAKNTDESIKDNSEAVKQ